GFRRGFQVDLHFFRARQRPSRGTDRRLPRDPSRAREGLDLLRRRGFRRGQRERSGRRLLRRPPTWSPVNRHFMEAPVMDDALKRASAASITAVMPYYGYARQDRKVAPRTPITAKLVADLIQSAGASRVVSMDLHAGQIQGFFNIPFDHLYALPVFLEYLRP